MPGIPIFSEKKYFYKFYRLQFYKALTWATRRADPLFYWGPRIFSASQQGNLRFPGFYAEIHCLDLKIILKSTFSRFCCFFDSCCGSWTCWNFFKIYFYKILGKKPVFRRFLKVLRVKPFKFLLKINFVLKIKKNRRKMSETSRKTVKKLKKQIKYKKREMRQHARKVRQHCLQARFSIS